MNLPELDSREIHHLVRVRRVRPGEQVEIMNGRGDVARAEVESTKVRTVRLKIHSTSSTAEPGLKIHLLAALPKGKTFPALLHKCVELGVSAITPLLTDNVEADGGRVNSKGERWESILVEALKQSGNPWMPHLSNPLTLVEALGNPSENQRLCAALQPDARPLWALLQDQLAPQGTIEVFVGPEGDFSPAEYALLRDSGCRFASLGPLVLKVETAASLVVGTLHIWANRGS